MDSHKVLKASKITSLERIFGLLHEAFPIISVVITLIYGIWTFEANLASFDKRLSIQENNDQTIIKNIDGLQSSMDKNKTQTDAYLNRIEDKIDRFLFKNEARNEALH